MQPSKKRKSQHRSVSDVLARGRKTFGTDEPSSPFRKEPNPDVSLDFGTDVRATNERDVEDVMAANRELEVALIEEEEK